ncbi:5'-nucleotidase C-terminal domain-containing protein [bacterium]|nr:5'-nucleotidase C-terminal domain-containing protein [bacterium]
MRKFFVAVFCIISVLTVFADDNKDRLLTVIFTNDSHGMAWKFDEPNNPGIGGLAAQKTLIDDIRAEVQGKGGNLLVLSAGDITLGDPRSNICENMPMVEGMNLVGYDAMTIGNHEFDFGFDAFRKMQEKAKFPFLSANMYEEGGTKSAGKEYIEKKFDDGLTVAVLGLTTRETESISGQGIKGNLTMSDPIETAKTWVPILKKKNDVLIVLSHLGFYDTDKSFDGYEGDNLLAKTVSGIDLIVGGHTQRQLESPIKINDTYIVQTEGLGKWVGRIDFYFQGKKIVKTDYKLYPINLKTVKGKGYEFVGKEIKENKAMVDMLNGFKCEFSTKQIGKIDRNLEGGNIAREKEIELGDVITDIIREKTGTQIAFMNAGSIRQGLKKGAVTEKDIYGIFPFNDTIFTAELTGAQIQEVLDFFAEKGFGVGGFLQVSGIEMKIFKGAALEIKIGGQKLDKTKKYKVAFNSFIANGGDGYTILKNIKSKKDTAYLVASVLIDHIKANGTFAKPKGDRIKIVKK